ncbi:hypothetical protein JHK82_017596 [Glycine max]|uniref:RNase H type-1 domain-containing protein n=1 Tax=Glycine max TaxID=3847 RepID=K7KZR3_SOYBN|nr:hypothetical protein JHK85_018035 [Glycine max]KAG5036814.1 hypothetical protein JHK86_017654 [Glycine max]KAG5141901.1 hypothetical protein JHK82_017596 [Glycine max]KAH1085505.1 hypothetical protein GYH30_017461 [Glycine max]KRH47825.1 hypothetical protein GLYMA_07G051100v4 [Glycine max]
MTNPEGTHFRPIFGTNFRILIRDVVCVSDSLHVISLIQAPMVVSQRYASIIMRIKDLLNFNWKVVLRHSLRMLQEFTF